MKSRLPQLCIAFAIAMCISNFNELIAQPFFTLDSVVVMPATPSDLDMVSVKLYGQRADSCSYLDSMDYAILGFDLDIHMDWDSLTTDSCADIQVAWDTTLNLGVLAAGTYNINMLGTNYADSTGQSLSFVVSASNDPCGTNSIIWVTNTSDSGPGSLREAITCANSEIGPNEIYFNIPGLTDQYIFVGQITGDSLPALTDGETIIDGTTQPGYGVGGDFSPKIIVSGDGTNWLTPINGLEIAATGVGIYGLEIREFPYNGIYINGTNGATIGTTGKGNILYYNGSPIDMYPGSVPEGPYEGSGIHIFNSGFCTVNSNIIGTDETLSASLGNEYCGVFIDEGGDNHNITFNQVGYHPEGGVIIEHNSNSCLIEQNEFFCNSNAGIDFLGTVNAGIEPPIINLVTAQMIQGTATGTEVDLYLSDDAVCGSSPCQGYTYLGTTTVSAGVWNLTAPFAHGDTIVSGQQVTAQVRDAVNNTSVFALCGVGAGLSACTDSIGQIYVTNTNDFGAGSLYEAIYCADTTIGSNIIRFDIPGTGPHTILVGGITGLPLPALTDVGTFIDGTSQPGYGAGGNFTPQIILDGGSANWNYPHNGLLLQGDQSRVSGIQMINFLNDGIKISGAEFCTIDRNVLYNNGAVQDNFPGAPGQGPFEGSGIVLEMNANNNRIFSNYIGTDYTETITTGNEYCGIYVDTNCDANEIGGLAKGNVISHNPEAIRVRNLSNSVLISENSIYCNQTVAIALEGTANESIEPPTFASPNATTTSLISGFITELLTSPTLIFGSRVELFLNDDTGCAGAPCQGKIFLGSSMLTGAGGNWQIEAPFENGVTLVNGDLVTAVYIDNRGNSSEFSECYIVADCMLSGTPVVVNETCGAGNGSITINPSGGPAPYIYDMGMGEQGSNIFNNLTAGTYNVTITDGYNCTTTLSATLTDSPLPTVAVGTISDEICDMQNGSFIATGSSGTAPYSYTLSTGANGPNFVGLAEGTYTVTISDTYGCTDTESVQIGSIAGPDLTVASITSETCSDGSGAILFNTSTGTPLFTYTIGFGNQNTPNFVGLIAGTYVATVTDINGCSDTATATVVDIPGPSAASTSNVINPNCGNPDGSFTVNVTGGTGPYYYDEGNGGQDTPNFTGLFAGSYVVTITDNNFCSITTSVTLTDEPGPSLTIVSTQAGNCGQANGSATVSASGGSPPYLYDIGNGNQSSMVLNGLSAGTYFVTVTDGNSCTAEEQVIINDIGGPTLTISNQTDETCLQANGSLTINASGGTDPFNFDIGNGPGSGQTFSGLSAGSYTVTVLDAAGCESLISATLTNTGTPPTADFTFVDVDGTLTFTNTTINGISYAWNFGDGNTSSMTNPVHTYMTSGTYMICLEGANACGPNLYCENVEVVVPPSIVTISGRFEKENGITVSTVDVSCTGQSDIENNGDGTYSFDMISVGGTYVVDPQKDTLYGNGVSTFDVFKIHQHVLTIDTLDTPYKIIAGDVDKGGFVSTYDTYLMQQVILTNVDTFPNNESWRFVPADYVFTNPLLPLLESFPETLTFTNIQADTINQDFIAIKVGDVTLNANPAFAPPPSGKIDVLIEDQALHFDEIIEVDFQLDESIAMAAMQFDLEFDSEALELVSIQEADVEGMNEGTIGQRFVEDGRLVFAWYDTQGLGQNMDAGTKLFKLVFKAKQNSNRLSDHLAIVSLETGNWAFELNGNKHEVNDVFYTTTSTKAFDIAQGLKSQPNPFTQVTQIEVTLAQQEKMTLKIYDLSGKIVYQLTENGVAGVNQLIIKAADLPAKGMYYIQVETDSFTQAEKIVLQ